jgi:ABC-type transport system involved in multi-copper enzyme maturation permease subunit
MLSVGIISSEVEDGTVLTILTKPIPRAAYVVGKYVGIAILIIAYAAILYVAIILFAFLGKQNFIQVFGLDAVIKGFFLFALQPLAIAALAVFGSTVFKTVNNGIFVIALYMLGTIGGIMEQIGSLANMKDLNTFGIVAGMIAPFEVIYRKLISTIFSSVGGFTSIMGMGVSGTSTEPSVWMLVYVMIYMGALIGFAIRRMNRKDIG